MQSGLRASLPALSVTGPAFVQNIYSNFTMKIHSVLWHAHTRSPEVSLPRGGDAGSSVLQRGVVLLKKWILGGLAWGTQTGSNDNPAAFLYYLTLRVTPSISKLFSCVIPVFLLELKPSSAHQV